MSFDATPGRIFVTDGTSGTVVFDTNETLLHLLSDPISGSFSRASMDWNGGLGATPSPNIRADDFFIANVPAATTHLVGLVKYDFGAGSGYAPALPSGSWFNAGGTHILMHQTFRASDGSVSGTAAVSSMAGATFYLSGSTIRYKEKIVLFDNRAEIVGISFPDFTVTYRLFPAAFS